MNFKKIVRLGTQQIGNYKENVFCKIEFKDGKLSISGVVGPRSNGDCRGSCGQIEMGMGDGDGITPAPGWTPKLIQRFLKTWRAWHLNDMRAGCEHQRAKGWGEEKITVREYRLNSKAREIRRAAESEAVAAAREGRAAKLSEVQRALLNDDVLDSRYQLPGPGDVLEGLYEVKETKEELSTWVYPNQHPKGVLTKKCPECGYEYGTKWLKEDVPADVLEFLEGLPDSDIAPAWI